MPTTLDPLVFGRRVRHYRKVRGLTLDELSRRVGKPAPYLSMLENGKKEPRLGLINDLAVALDVPVGDLLEPEAPTPRDRLEVEIERIQRDQAYRELGLPYLKPSARIPDVALEHIVRLYAELRGRDAAVAFTRDEARAANAELRAEMKARGNYFGEIEAVAAEAVAAIDYQATGAMSKGDLNALARHFGFRLIRTGQLPPSTRAVADLKNRVIHVPGRDLLDPARARSVVLQTLGHFALGHREPRTFAEFLRQRVETNYFAGAVLIPEVAAVPFLQAAKAERNLSVEDVKDRFFVSYEMAAHRFTNLATEHLGLATHFVRSDEQGIIWKAYENNDVPFPKNSVGAIEGQRLCREWGTRRAFRSDARYAIHYQYTDTSRGTYWCATFVEEDREPPAAITTGVRFEDAKWFRGWDTDRHSVSRCPDGDCCRRPPEELAARWEGLVWPSVRPNSHVLAAMPVETVPGVDMLEILEFLEAHDQSEAVE
ncbi:MAG TPA: helix-turn-helix domain-containing protein [Actinobacteria bacterium]|nr:helix-turn-helix domain-containing protein [Actinomycetota bacterium]